MQDAIRKWKGHTVIAAAYANEQPDNIKSEYLEAVRILLKNKAYQNWFELIIKCKCFCR